VHLLADCVASLTGDAAYDRDDVHAGTGSWRSDSGAIVSLRLSAAPSSTEETVSTQRDAHLRGQDRLRSKLICGWSPPVRHRSSAIRTFASGGTTPR
jgi:hypothetical protein